jgi:GTP-binding protein EngB required for normal cell division
MHLAVSDGSRASGSALDSGSRSIASEEADKLLRIASLAEQFNNDQIRDDARSAAERIAEGRFYVACVGQFKRGKSTLLNALIGESILPSGVVPVTSVPTILRFGKDYAARVRLNSGEWTDIAVADIEQYVSEGRNPENSKGVAALEVFIPSPLLADGMCFVDTPGLGSVFAGNTAATHAFIPHIDAAIVVIGADPPIAGDELALVETVSKQVPDTLFVLNKADRVTEAERTSAISFARRVLENRLQWPIPFIFEISALEQLDKGGAQREWAQFVDSLERLTQQSGHQLVGDAADRSVRRLSSQLLTLVKEERDALTRPFEESEKRIGQLREIVAHAEQSIDDLAYLFLGEQQRLSKTFSDHRNVFLKSVRAVAHRELSLALKALPRSTGPQYRRSAMKAAQGVARHHVMPWLESEKKNAEEAHRRIAKRFMDLANDFLSRVRSLGTELANLPKKMHTEQNFRTRSGFQFYEFVHLARPASPLRYAADLVLGSIRAHATIDADAREFFGLLLETNSERVRNDLEQRVEENRRHLEAKIRSMLRELGTVAERALTRARSAHAAGTVAVESSLRRLARVEADVAHLTEVHTAPMERS